MYDIISLIVLYTYLSLYLSLSIYISIYIYIYIYIYIGQHHARDGAEPHARAQRGEATWLQH